MDNNPLNAVDARRPQCRFGPDRRLTLVTAVGAGLAVMAALLTTDAAGRLLFIGAAAVLAGYAVVDVRCWPRLAADADGILVRSPFSRTVLSWDAIESIGADVRERLGLRSSTLEIDAGERLVVFSRRALGADPAHVADVVRAFDPRRAGSA